MKTRTRNTDELYVDFLKDNWIGPTGTPNPCCFMTYFKSTDVMFKAMGKLSYAEVGEGTLRLPDGMHLTANVVRDRNRIVLAMLSGQFTMRQAKEAVAAFGKYADHDANQLQDMGSQARTYLSKLKEKGVRQIVVAW